MRAAVYHGPGDVRIETRDIPEASSGEVLLKVSRSGMCGTDGSEWKSGPRIFPLNRTHPVSGHSGPLVLGHEFVGEVVQLGPGVSDWTEGDRVASGAGFSCGSCDRCLENRTNLCFSYVTLGLNRDGGMAEYVAVPGSTLELLPEGLGDDHAALAQPLAVGLHAVRRSGVRNGDTVVLIGAGAIGTFVLAGLKHLFDLQVVVVDFAGRSLERASRLGADFIVAVDEDLENRVRELIGPRGADVVIEASGAPGQTNVAGRWIRQGGTLLQVGLPSKAQEIDIHPLVMNEITVETTLAHVCGDDLAPALEILNSTGLAEELADGVFPLNALPEQLERLTNGEILGKVLIDPHR